MRLIGNRLRDSRKWDDSSRSTKSWRNKKTPTLGPEGPLVGVINLGWRWFIGRVNSITLISREVALFFNSCREQLRVKVLRRRSLF